jgi:hypothetical protein
MAGPVTPIAFRVSFSFNQQAGPRASGWSMNFYNNATDLASVIPRAAALAPLLQAAVGKQSQLTWVNARLIYNPPGSKGTRLAGSLPIIKPGGPANATAKDSDYPTTALLMELRTASGFIVRQTIRAVPDDDTTIGGWYTPGDVSSKNTTALLTQLGTASEGWSLLTQDPSKGHVQIQGFDTTTGNVSCLGHGFLPNDVIRITGKKIGATPRLNGKWRVDSVKDANTFHLMGWPNTTDAQVLNLNSATAQLQNWVLTQIAFDKSKPLTSQVTYSTERKVGRPRKVLTGVRKTLR